MRKLLLILICLSLLLGNAFAASDEITKMDAQITVDNNGICTITVLAEVRFVSQPTTFLFPLGTEAGNIAASGASYSSKTIDGVKCILFENESGFSGSQSFQCSYSLPCTMVETSQGQRFTAKLPERGWELPINRYRLTITFPTEVTAFPRWHSSYYGDVIDNYLSIQVKDNTVTASSNIVFRDHETLTMELDFQPHSFALKHLAEQTVPFDRLIFISLYALCILFAIPFFRAGRGKRKKEPVLQFQSSPGDVPCQLFGRSPEAGALIAHWGNLGYILLHRTKTGRFRLEKLMDMGNERSSAERRIFKALFRSTAFIDVGGARFMNAWNTEAPVLRAHWKNRMFERKGKNPRLIRLLCLIAGFFFSLMVFDILLPATSWRWFWLFLLTPATLPLYWLLQQVPSRYYRPDRWLSIGLGAGGALILYLLASPADCGGFLFFTLLLQLAGGYVTRFGGKRTTAGTEIVEAILSFRKFIAHSDSAAAKQLVTRDSQYFYRTLPYAEILGLGNRFRKHFAPITTEACPWLVEERNGLSSPGAFYTLYTELLQQLRIQGQKGALRSLGEKLSASLPRLSLPSGGSSGRRRDPFAGTTRAQSRSHSPRTSSNRSRNSTYRRTQHRANPARTGRRR